MNDAPQPDTVDAATQPSGSRPGRASREWALRLFVSALGLLVTFGLFEGAVHVVEGLRGPLFPGGGYAQRFTQDDPLLGWRHPADVSQRYRWPGHPDGHITFATNNLGLREDGPTEPRPAPGVVRVLALGDSHTDGVVNNAESWPNVVERLGGADDAPWEVLNAGVTGYQPWQYYLWWRSAGRALEPEVVVLGYYLGNDLLNVGGRRLERDATGAWSFDETVEPVRGSRLGNLPFEARRLCRTCALASLVAHRSVLSGPTFEEARSVRGSNGEERSRHLSAIRHCIGCLWQSLQQRWLIEGDPDAYTTRIAETAEVLRRLRDEVRETGARFVVVVIPTKLQVEPGAVTKAAETAALLGIDALHPLFEDRLESDIQVLLAREGIESVETRNVLEREHDRTGEAMYYDFDWHLNVAGSRVVGETVRSALATGPS